MRCATLLGMSCLVLWNASELSAAVDYLAEVKPLLLKHCTACHGPVRQKGGLRLDTATAITTGGESGTAVSTTAPMESLLLGVLTGDAGFRMPPEGEGERLSEAEVAIITAWVKEGAHAPANEEALADPKEYWSYQPFVRPQVSHGAEDSWSYNSVDRFIRQKHL